MSTEEEVASFLNEFKTKLSIYDIFYFGRSKNAQTLIDLEIKPIERTEILKKLAVPDYSEGPIEERMMNGADMWVFGKVIKEKEVYIKITLGNFGERVICISFHISEHQMNYPLK